MNTNPTAPCPFARIRRHRLTRRRADENQHRDNTARRQFVTIGHDRSETDVGDPVTAGRRGER